jgi:hypothetical protein
MAEAPGHETSLVKPTLQLSGRETATGGREAYPPPAEGWEGYHPEILTRILDS